MALVRVLALGVGLSGTICGAAVDDPSSKVSAASKDELEPAAVRPEEVKPAPATKTPGTKGLVAPPGGFEDVSSIEHIRLDIRYAGTHNFTGAPLPGYETPGAWLRTPAATALVRVASELARERGWGLIVYDAYRPRRASEAMVKWARANDHEEWLDGWIAARSQHNRGMAVDVGVYVIETSALVDMGTEFDAFVPASGHRAHADPEVESRRRTLRAAMKRAGFAPYIREWWHYGFPGDAAALDRAYETR